MKNIKRIGAVILTLTMFLSMNLTGVFATTDATGRDPAANVSLTVSKYKHDESITFPEKNDGTEIKDMPAGAQPVSGVVFKIEKVTLKNGAAEPTAEPKDYEPVTGNEAFSTTGTTNNDGIVVFSSDPAKSTAEAPLIGQGIYKVSEIKSATPGTAAIKDFIVSLPMTNPDPNTKATNPWMYEVYAYPKNDVQDPIKKEVVQSGTDGNVIAWKYSVLIPKDMTNPLTKKEILVVTDKLDNRLSYVTDSIVGNYVAKDSAAEIDLKIVDDYTIDVTGNMLKITMTETGLGKLQAATVGTGSNVPTLYFTFKTRTNIANTSQLELIKNGGELDYTNSDGLKYATEIVDDPVKPTKDLYGIKINKINLNNETLSGAVFNVYTSKSAAEAGTTTEALLDPNGRDVWTITTGNDGIAYFNGLVEGTYYLVETASPSGYQLLSDPITVVINATTVSADRTVSITVTNNKSFALPLTGGMGTTIFIVGGLTLIGVSVTLFILSKRKKTNKNTNN